MDQKVAFRHITKRVPIEKAHLTYRLLSRELGITVTQSKELLASYLQEPSAKERGVSAVYLLSGFLTRNPTIENGKNGHNEDEQGMDVDGRDEPTSTQENDTKEVFRTRTVMLVTSEELKVKSSLFSPEPSSHIYALTPSALPRTEFSQLTTAYLPIANSSKWKPAPEKDAIGGGYGGITSSDGKETKRKGKIVRKPTTGGSTNASASTSGSGSGSKVSNKVAEEKGKGKASTTTTVKKEEASSSTTLKKGKKKVEEESKKKAPPKIVPIGQRGGLFSKSFAAKKEESSDEEEEEEESEDEVKSKKKGKSVPAKRKSNSPQVSRKAPPAPVPTKKPSPKKAKGKEVIDLGDDDEDDWAMDEEAMAEMEREANEKVQAKKPVPPKKKPVVTKKKENETDSERQKRELEEMMAEDGEAMDVDEKPRPAPSRTSSSSSTNTKPVPAKSKSSSSSSSKDAKPQGDLKSFFKR